MANIIILAMLGTSIVSLVLVILGIVFLATGKRDVKRCTAKTTGHVIDYVVRGGDNGHSVAPKAEFTVNGQTYTATRKYKGVVSVHKSTLNPEKLAGEEDNFYISENDVFHMNTMGFYHDYRSLAASKWPLGSEITVYYDPKKPERAYVERVVSGKNTVGIVFLCVGIATLSASFLPLILL